MKKQKILGFIFLILTVIMWGASFISIKITLKALPPLSLAFVRYFIASIILYSVHKIKNPNEKLKKEDIKLMSLGGILGITLYFFFENNGIDRISPNEASIIMATLPVAAIIGDFFAYKTKLNLKKIMSVIISLVGVYFAIGGTSGISGNATGYLLMLGAVASWVIYMLITKPLFEKYSDGAIAAYQSIFGTLAFIPFLGLETINWQLFDTTLILNLIYLSVFCSAFASYFYVTAMNSLGVTVSSIAMNMIPVTTILFSFLIFKEVPSFIQIIGSLLVIISICMANSKE